MDPGSEDALESHGESSSESGKLIGPMLLRLRNAVAMAMLCARQKFFNGVFMLCALFLLLWTAAFLYGSFYYSFMPNSMYTTPVHYYYRTDCDSAASYLCSFPVANISLLSDGNNQVMTFGQPYRISLQLEMPNSPANQELGMFTVRMTCYSKEGGDTVSSSRSAQQLKHTSSSRFTMLRYQSGFLRTLGTLLFLPAFMTGVLEQKQLVEVELFSDYTDNPYAPAVGAIIEILSNKVQIYSSQLYIQAHFTGIRYLMFNFPLMSALVGMATNLVFLSMLLLLRYLRERLGAVRAPQRSGGRPSEDRGQQECNEDGNAERNSLADAVGSTRNPLGNHTCKARSRTCFPSSNQGGEGERPCCSQSE